MRDLQPRNELLDPPPQAEPEEGRPKDAFEPLDPAATVLSVAVSGAQADFEADSELGMDSGADGGSASVAGAPAPSSPLLTPMMRQYMELKAQHPGAILFFRLGDFYEMFQEDAERGAAILQIALTARSKGPDKIPMCGVPYHSAKRYIAKLIGEGLKVAICEQEEDPHAKGILKRKVTRIITPGMVLDDEVLTAKENNFLTALCCSDSGYGAALLDVTTGEFFAVERPSVETLAEELARFSIREVLVAEAEVTAPWVLAVLAALPERPALATLEAEGFSPVRSAALLKLHFQVSSLEGFGLSDSPLLCACAGAALRYLQETQKSDARHVDRISVLPPGRVLLLDQSTLSHLEVLRTLKDGQKKGSLLWAVDRTKTPMGGRALSRWLSAPLRSVQDIRTRQDAVEELFGKAVWRQELSSQLAEVGDLERLSSRLALGVGNARDLLSLGKSLLQLPKLSAVLSRTQSELLLGLRGPLEGLSELGRQLVFALVEEPPLTLKDGGLFRKGFHPELDRLLELSTSGKDVLLCMEAQEKERTGISSLKIRFNKVFGYYLEVTKPNLHLVPKDYIRKQTTVSSERFVTEELKTYEEQVLTAEDSRGTLEAQLYETLRSQVVEVLPAIRAAAEAVAALDALLSFAQVAVEHGYVRPSVEDSLIIDIRGGRHPVVERMLSPGDLFVPNDLRLSPEEGVQLLVITGPNMAGKSTAMRQVALCVLLAQAGSFVPAASARIGLCDRIFTRVGASDNLAKGQSTFMVEMTETAHILHHATSQSLLVLDEIGRGTSTYDGLSIAWAVAEHLHDQVGARTLFATHYHELTDLCREKPRAKNCASAATEVNGKVVFLRKLVPGAASKSYGIEVAKLAGLPKEVLGRAREILTNLESGELDEAGRPALLQKNRKKKDAQLGLFVEDVPVALSVPIKAAELRTEDAAVLSELRKLEVNALTPLSALNLLAKLKAQLA